MYGIQYQCKQLRFLKVDINEAFVLWDFRVRRRRDLKDYCIDELILESGKLLASVGEDDYRTIVIWNWKKGEKIASQRFLNLYV